MAQFVYIDETGMAGTTGAGVQPILTLVGVLVDEEQVRKLTKATQDLAMECLGWLPAGFEFHGYELWQGLGHWAGLKPPERLATYEAAIALLDQFDLRVVHSSIEKTRLHERYEGKYDSSAYCLGLQFLLEKVDRLSPSNRIVVADEAHEHELRAVQMVAGLQFEGVGEVPGVTLKTVIDSLHYVRSNMSAGVQLADLVAYVLHTCQPYTETHPDAEAGLSRMREIIRVRTPTFRSTWPSAYQR